MCPKMMVVRPPAYECDICMADDGVNNSKLLIIIYCNPQLPVNQAPYYQSFIPLS